MELAHHHQYSFLLVSNSTLPYVLLRLSIGQQIV
ncbi:hypothetical protein F444_00565 [Phytophthora nicotianae P1976]|nr:hypothetical protein F444_00565 [Phytophthora nicotianae P1976]